MTPSNFSFLEAEYPILFNIGQSAEYHLHTDPAASLIKLRLFAERLTVKLFEEHALAFPEENTQFQRLKSLEFEQVLPYSIKDILHHIRKTGNTASHSGEGEADIAKHNLLLAFKLAKWYYETYSHNPSDITGVRFQIPANLDARHALKLLEDDYKELEAKFNQLLAERNTQGLPNDKQQAIKQRSEKAASKIEMSEAETRELIDEQLRKAGWEADTNILNYKKYKILPQRGRNMAIAEWPAGPKWADYALFVGLELYSLVEAKKYAQDISTDLGQSKIYAELVEAKNDAELIGKWDKYKVPFLFSTNGRPYLEQIKTKSGVWFLDIRKATNNARPLQGWYSPAGLAKLLEQDVDAANKKLETTPLDFLQNKSGLGLREYQIKAIQAVEKKIIQQPDDRRALIAMATGTGKTRTIIGLCYHLIQTNRFKRVLFLVDRTLLGTQAINSFKDNKVVDLNTFADVYEIKELKHIAPDVDTRLHFATVQGMVKRLFYNESDEQLPSVDQYDCIIIDEAHRGYLLDKQLDEEDLAFKDQRDYISKYRMVLDYFDAYAIGLTATPALHTKEIFGSAVYTYSYREAVIDGYLIDHEPPYLIETELNENGISWQKGEKPKALDKETNSIVELEELDDELKIDVAGFNKLVLTESFNRTVVQQLVQHLDPDSEEKTLIFAATDSHADMLVALLKEEFSKTNELPDNAIEKITGKSYDPAEQVKRFKNEKYPNIAVTVDLLTTGIDVPAICNIVFLRKIKSRILYEQMLGRATRRCDEIKKETFRIFDAVKLYETLQDYTQMKPVVTNPTTTFVQLAEELPGIDTNERARQQIEQLVAKLQRKKQKMNSHHEEQFKYTSGGSYPDEMIDKLLEQPVEVSVNEIVQLSGLWKFLDELKLDTSPTLVSDHQDQYKRTKRGYGKGQKPEDYLESFAKFIKENQNKIAALNIICTNPKKLNRQSLKELYMELSLHNFFTNSLKEAWKEAKKQDIAADIISFIRAMTMNSETIEDKTERIKRAVDKVRAMRPWNKTQSNWLDRFEKQLMAETVLQLEDLNRDPFKDAGGFQRLDKVFEHQLTEVIETINDNLYIQTA
ncbi:type I restriction-modification system endonuclease [Botryobacter ruber]|uniref:type I restriction-modification system endonuclease n=1 Tax=Botryobacter ruber TaxID=2171629 RepID=UPI000E09ED57|nr:type I restriction-modification system endonuclease [Botryobacter ruber]